MRGPLRISTREGLALTLATELINPPGAAALALIFVYTKRNTKRCLNSAAFRTIASVRRNGLNGK